MPGLSGPKTPEAWELRYFELYKSQLKVVELALETAALTLGTDKSRGYSLEMICADFLAGDNLEAGNPQALKLAVQTGSGSRALSLSYPKRRRIRLEGKFYERLRQAVLQRDNWRCQRCGKSRGLQIHHIEPRSHLRTDREENLIILCWECHHAATVEIADTSDIH